MKSFEGGVFPTSAIIQRDGNVRAGQGILCGPRKVTPGLWCLHVVEDREQLENVRS